MTYIIAEPCVDVKDRACVEVCPVDCIYEGARSLYIHPNECVDCAACEPVCPVEAIFPVEQVPERFSAYIEVNETFFTEVTGIGEPGGAADVGRLDTDHPMIASLPKRAAAV